MRSPYIFGIVTRPKWQLWPDWYWQANPAQWSERTPQPKPNRKQRRAATARERRVP